MQQNGPEQHYGGASPTQGGAQGQNEMGRLEQELRAEQRKSEEYLEMLRRSQADFVNYRRRVGQEKAEADTASQIALLQRLLPVLDDLGRALTSTPAELAGQPWVQGIHLVARRLGGLLEELGVRQVGREGERFDPRWHEAVAMGVQPAVPEGTILHVAQPGYILGERIIRPARVVVSTAPSPADA